MNFYIAQGISILTAAVAVVMMQMKTMEKILAGQILANLLTASTYFLLGGFSGAGICFIAIVQSVVMYAVQKKKHRLGVPWVVGFIVLYIACSAWYYQSAIDLFSAAAAVFFALSVSTDNPAASRRWYVVNPLCWMVYDICTRAYVNFGIHLVIFISTGVAMMRLDRKTNENR